jgi:hypothetical protein
MLEFLLIRETEESFLEEFMSVSAVVDSDTWQGNCKRFNACEILKGRSESGVH